MKGLDLSAGHLKTVRTILGSCVPDAEVWAFGSRVRATAAKTSDLDLALISRRPISLKRRALLRDAFSESSLPFKVDFVEWRSLSKNFQKIISENHQVLCPSNRKMKKCH